MRALALILATVALAASACSSGSDSSADRTPGPSQETTPAPAPNGEAQHFTMAQLPELALQPDDAPAGMRYTKDASGRMSLADVGLIVETQIAEVRSLGFKAVYDATFDGTSTDLRLASRLWLFDDVTGAQNWLDKTESDSQQYAFEPLTAPDLGEASWAGRGNLAADVITYAFRTGNLVVITSYTTQTEKLSESVALAAAQKAAARIARA